VLHVKGNDLFSVGAGGGLGQLIDTGISNPITVGPVGHPTRSPPERGAL